MTEQLKTSDDDIAYGFVLGDKKNFTQKIEPMSENINPGLFNEFFESSPVYYAKYVVDLKDTTENKEFVIEIGNRVSDLKDTIKKMSETEKEKIIEEIFNYNKQIQKALARASKIDKIKSEPKPEKSAAERTKLRRQRSDEIAQTEKKISLELFIKYFHYLGPSSMYKTLNETKKLGRKQGTSKYNRK